MRKEWYEEKKPAVCMRLHLNEANILNKKLCHCLCGKQFSNPLGQIALQCTTHTKFHAKNQ